MARTQAAAGFDGTETAVAIQDSPSDAFAIDSLITETVELKNLGNTLPLGVFYEGRRLQEFTFKPFGGTVELELSQLSKRFQKRAADIFPPFLSKIVDTIGGVAVKDLASASDKTPTDFFASMTLADTLTILLRLRLEEFGKEIKMAARCPSCGANNKDREGEFSDLSSTEIVVVKNLPCLVGEVVLKTGATVFEDTVNIFNLRPVRLSDLKRFTKDKDRAQLEINHELLMYTVVAIPQSQAYGNSRNEERDGVAKSAVEEVYKKLNTRDRHELIKATGVLAELGPSLQVEMTCRSCGFDDWKAQIAWQDISSFLSFPA